MGKLPLIYFAAPLFNENERRFNDGLAARLAEHVDVFLPQRDGELLVELVRSGVELPIAERRVFQNDIRALNSAALLVAILDGGYIDEGVAFEIGFANGVGTLCVGLQTDVRRALPSGNNPMISQGLANVFDCVDSLVEWVSEWSKRRAIACAPAA